jgi:hypothetical protein
MLTNRVPICQILFVYSFPLEPDLGWIQTNKLAEAKNEIWVIENVISI